ncbi:MAG TPA: PocR ligand-binding domain-containing protein, partial [Bacteroidales bacterium]
KDEFHFEFRRFTKDGQIKWLSQWSRPVSYEGKRGILTTMVDIDEQKKRQDAISESETRLRTKLNLILSPDKPISNLNIKDLFDLEQLQKIQDSFAISNNIASIITDTEGIPITRPSNFNKICKFIRSSQTGRALCYNSDKIIGLKAREILKPFITKCSSCGFLDAGAPIIVGGQHIGTWLIGQVPDNKTNESQVSKFAEHIGIDPEKLIALFYEVKSVDIEQFKKVVNFLWVITGEISALGYNNLKQARDIEDRKKIEIALRESEELYRQLVQASPDGIALVDLKGKMLYVSPKAKQMFGFPTDYNAEDLCIFDYIHPSQRKIAISNVSSIFEKNAPHPGSYLMLRKDGSTFSAEVNSTPVKDYLGNTKGMISILRDITERKKVEEELIKAKNKAEESDNLKSAFLANMSHEIRTPMNGILGFASLLNERETTLRQRREYSEIINQNGNLLLKLIDDILDIAKIEAGQLKIFEAPFYLDQIMYKQYMLFKTLLKKEKRKDLKLSLILPDPKLSNQIKTDEARLNQVLTNLLSNSIKFTKKGLVEFGYTFESTKMLKFYVKDTGIGLTPDKFSIIFDRFRQAEESSAKNYGGTGLGLTISSNLVRLMGGKIWVESEIGKGSTFYFTIPFKPINGEKKQIEYLPAFSGSNHYDWHNKCILVVEDEHLNFLLLQEFLKNTCANLLWVQNGKEAIDLCKENNMINLVLMDLKLPKINGYTAICEIKKFRRNLPIIAQSAYAMEEEIKKCREAGCDEYITKPIDHQKLLHLINGYFKT